MKTRALLFAVLTAVVLWGCQSIPGKISDEGAATRKHCQGGDTDPEHCVVKVTSFFCSFFKCLPWVDFDVVQVDGGVGRGNHVMWVLSGPGAEFAEPPIVFESGARGFTCERRGPKVAVCTNAGETEKGKPVKYSIRVKDAPVLDPWMVNN